MLFFKKNKKKSEELVKKIEKKDLIKRYAMLFVGLILIALAFNMFLEPNDIVFGGVSGLSIITKKLFGINPSTFILIASIILLIVSYVVLGPEKSNASVLGSLLFPIIVYLTENIAKYVTVESGDLLLVAIFGGVLYGFGAGLVFKAGFTTGGTDIVNQIISKYVGVSMGTALLMSDGLIVLGGVFVFGVTKLLYALVVLYIISLLTDKVLLGISDSKAFYIITEKEEEVKDFILNGLNHGVTVFNAKGGYKNEKQRVLFCVIPTKEYFKLKEGITSLDKSAFFVATDAYEVSGGE